MKPTPPNWPRISPALFYEDPAAAIDWLCRAFGFEIRIKVEGENGRIEHCELDYGDGLLMVGGAGPAYRQSDAPDSWKHNCKSPKQVGGAITQNLCIYIDDVDAHCEHVRSCGGEILNEPMTADYGEDYWTDRTYAARDPEGHVFWFLQRLRSGKNA